MEGRVGPKLVLLLRSVRMLELRLEPKSVLRSVRMLEPWTELRLVPQMVPRLSWGGKEGWERKRNTRTGKESKMFWDWPNDVQSKDSVTDGIRH